MQELPPRRFVVVTEGSPPCTFVGADQEPVGSGASCLMPRTSDFVHCQFRARPSSRGAPRVVSLRKLFVPVPAPAGAVVIMVTVVLAVRRRRQPRQSSPSRDLLTRRPAVRHTERGSMTAAEGPSRGKSLIYGNRLGGTASTETVRDAALSLTSTQRAATECVRVMDDFEAAHGSETIEQSRT